MEIDLCCVYVKDHQWIAFDIIMALPQELDEIEDGLNRAYHGTYSKAIARVPWSKVESTLTLNVVRKICL